MLPCQDSAFSIPIQRENSTGSGAVLTSNEAFLATDVQKIHGAYVHLRCRHLLSKCHCETCVCS